jgi:hypothetical protein
MRSPISEKLRTAIERSGRRRWQLARAVGLHPSVLSSLVSGARDASTNDVRILRLAEALNVPTGEAFEVREVAR